MPLRCHHLTHHAHCSECLDTRRQVNLENGHSTLAGGEEAANKQGLFII